MRTVIRWVTPLLNRLPAPMASFAPEPAMRRIDNLQFQCLTTGFALVVALLFASPAMAQQSPKLLGAFAAIDYCRYRALGTSHQSAIATAISENTQKTQMEPMLRTGDGSAYTPGSVNFLEGVKSRCPQYLGDFLEIPVAVQSGGTQGVGNNPDGRAKTCPPLTVMQMQAIQRGEEVRLVGGECMMLFNGVW